MLLIIFFLQRVFYGNAFKQRFVKQKTWKMQKEFKRKENDFSPIAPRINRGWHVNLLLLCFVFSQPAVTVSGFAVIHLPCFALSSAGDLADGVFGGPGGWAAVHAVTTGALFLFSRMDVCTGLFWESERIKHSAQTHTTLHADSVPRSKPLRQPEASVSMPQSRWFKDCLALKGTHLSQF